MSLLWGSMSLIGAIIKYIYYILYYIYASSSKKSVKICNGSPSPKQNHCLFSPLATFPYSSQEQKSSMPS